jgi:hypothetical protein
MSMLRILTAPQTVISFCGAGSRRTPGLLDEVLKPGEDSLPGEAAEGSNLAEVHRLSTKRSIARGGPYMANVGLGRDGWRR